MDKLQQAFLLLLRQGLWDKKEDTGRLFPLSDSEWMSLYRMSCVQGVQGIIYDGIKLLDNTCQAPRPLLVRWTVDIDSLERLNRHHLATIHFLYNYFTRKNNLPFILLKGEGIGAYYRHPLHRVCGDIDLYFYERSEEAHWLIEALGIPVKREQDRKRSNNASYVINGVSVEHRIRFMTLHNPFTRKRLKRMQNEWFKEKALSQLPIGEAAVPTLNPEMNQIMQTAHILKHLLTEGIGLRQCCDMAQTLYATRKDIDSVGFKRKLKQLGLYRFAKIMYDLLVKHLGYPAEELPFKTDACSDSLLKEIISSGNFGSADEQNNQTATIGTRKYHTFTRVTGKCLSFFTAAPGEAFWWPVELICKNILQTLKR